jgi:hypothetical protein
MGIDWQGFIKIYSDNDSHLQNIIKNVKKYISERQISIENEGYVYKTDNCITFSFSEHTVGLWTGRIDDGLNLYELSKLVKDYPSCFIKALWYADSGTLKRYYCWSDPDKWDKTSSVFISYETIDDDFYRYNDYYGKRKTYYPKINKDFILDTDFTIHFQLQSHGVIETESIVNQLTEKCIGLIRSDYCNNWIDCEFVSDTLDDNLFYKIIQTCKDHSYIEVEWHTNDGLKSGLWVASKIRGLTIKSIEIPINPNYYTSWDKGQKINITDEVRKYYLNDKI